MSSSPCVLFAVAVSALTAGCGFDGGIPEGAQLVCTQDAECPDGALCATRIGRCVASAGRDDHLPDIVPGSVVPPATPWIRLGQTLSVSFEVDEPLFEDPLVAGATLLQRLPLTVRADGDQRYTATLIAGAEIEESTIDLGASLVDHSGNENTVVLLSSAATFDFTAPEPVVVTAAPSTVVPGAQLVVQLVADSDDLTPDVAPALTLTFPGVPTPVAGSVVAASGNGATFLVSVPTEALDGDISAALTPLTDRAGNAGAPGEFTAVARVDSSRPPATLLVGALYGDADTVTVQANLDPAPTGVELNDTTVVIAIDDVACFAEPASACFEVVTARECTCDVPANTLEQGTHRATLSVIDPAGNFTIDARLFDVDLDAPGLVPGAARIDYVAPAGHPRSDVSAAAAGVLVNVSFVATEGIGAAVLTVSDGTSALQLPLTPTPPTGFSASLLITDAHTSGDWTATASLTDLAGNTADRNVGGFVVDRVPPSNPADTMTLTRVPWGDPPSVQISCDGTVAAGDLLVVHDSDAAATTATELRRVAALVDGSLPVIDMGTRDLARAYVGTIDRAGNRDAEDPTEIPTTRWTAEPRGRVPGSAIANPHRVRVAGRLADSLDQPFAEERAGAALATADGSTLDIAPAGHWAAWGGPGARLQPAIRIVFGFDRARNVSVLLVDNGGGLAETWEFDGERAELRAGQSAGTFGYSYLTWDPISGAVLALDFFGDALRAWDGAGWTTLATLPAAITDHAAGFVFDERRGVAVVLHSSTGEVTEWDGVAFNPRGAVAGLGPPVTNYTRVACYDPTLERVLIAGSYGSQQAGVAVLSLEDNGTTLSAPVARVTNAGPSIDVGQLGSAVCLGSGDLVVAVASRLSRLNGAVWQHRTYGPLMTLGHDENRGEVMLARYGSTPSIDRIDLDTLDITPFGASDNAFTTFTSTFHQAGVLPGAVVFADGPELALDRLQFFTGGSLFERPLQINPLSPMVVIAAPLAPLPGGRFLMVGDQQGNGAMLDENGAPGEPVGAPLIAAVSRPDGVSMLDDIFVQHDCDTMLFSSCALPPLNVDPLIDLSEQRVTTQNADGSVGYILQPNLPRLVRWRVADATVEIASDTLPVASTMIGFDNVRDRLLLLEDFGTRLFEFDDAGTWSELATGDVHPPIRLGGVLATLRERETTVLVGGSVQGGADPLELWQWHSAGTARAAVIFDVALVDAGLSGTHAVRAIDVALTVGAIDDTTLTVAAFVRGRWRALVEVTAGHWRFGDPIFDGATTELDILPIAIFATRSDADPLHVMSVDHLSVVVDLERE